MKKLALLAFALLLTGCGTTNNSNTQVQTSSVETPVVSSSSVEQKEKVQLNSKNFQSFFQVRGDLTPTNSVSFPGGTQGYSEVLAKIFTADKNSSYNYIDVKVTCKCTVEFSQPQYNIYGKIYEYSTWTEDFTCEFSLLKDGSGYYETKLTEAGAFTAYKFDFTKTGVSNVTGYAIEK